MTPILILEAFGELPSTNLIDSERERERREREDSPTGATEVGLLHEAFDTRAELMGWSSTSISSRNLWNMYEAGLTGDGADPSLIGWVYVGLANPTDLSAAVRATISETVPEGAGAGGWATFPMPPGYSEATVGLSTALPPLVQCFHDALRRIGVVAVSGFQVTCYGAHFGPRGRSGGHLVSGASWFNVPAPARADALITFDQGFLGGYTPAELVENIRRRHTGAFGFGQVVSVPGQHQVRAPSATPRPDIALEPSGLGVSVALPEWTASAAGWTLATVVDAARVIAPNAENFSVRLARVE